MLCDTLHGLCEVMLWCEMLYEKDWKERRALYTRHLIQQLGLVRRLCTLTWCGWNIPASTARVHRQMKVRCFSAGCHGCPDWSVAINEDVYQVYSWAIEVSVRCTKVGITHQGDLPCNNHHVKCCRNMDIIKLHRILLSPRARRSSWRALRRQKGRIRK